MKKPIFGKRKPQKRVVVNTLKQASNDAASQDVSEVSKLESVLVSLRAADIDRLANLAAASVGINPGSDSDGTTTTPTTTNTIEAAIDRIEPVDRRILSAKCVVEQLDIMVAALKAIQTKAERQQRQQLGQEEEHEKVEKGSDDDKRKRRKVSIASGSDIDDEEERSESSEEESEVDPDDDALQAIEKLLALKKTIVQKGGGGRGVGGDDNDTASDYEGEEEYLFNSEDESGDDSGVIENVSEQEEDLMNIDSEEDDEEKGGNYMRERGGTDSDRHPKNQRKSAAVINQPMKKVKGAAKPKKSKNRLGQRARRQLGEQQQMQGGRKPAPYRQGVQQNIPRQPSKDGLDGGGGGGSGSGGGGGYREGRKDNFRDKRSIEKVDEGPLHPSWAARRQEKVKLSIVNSAVAPSNKKIVFDEDGSKKTIVPPKPSSSSAAATHKINKKQKMSQESEGPLHPSWELKKKLANAQKHIQPAQGKKIVFDD